MAAEPDLNRPHPAASSTYPPQTSCAGRLIVVDDEVDLLNALCDRLTSRGFEVTPFTSARAALEHLQSREFDLLLTDVMMPEMDGLALLRAALECDRHLVGVMMTGQGTIQTAVEAMKIGAVDYILKPFKTQMVLPVLERALELRRLRMENLSLRETVALHEICHTVSGTRDWQVLLEQLVAAALQQCHADEACILLPTYPGKPLAVGALRQATHREPLSTPTLPIPAIAEWVAAQQRPLVLQGLAAEPQLPFAWPCPELHAVVAVPMLAGGEFVGVLVAAASAQRTITQGQIKALHILASVGGAAIQGVQLYAAARSAEAQYRSIFEGVTEGIFRITPAGKFALANPALAKILGYPSAPALLDQVTDVGQDLFRSADRWQSVWQTLQQQESLQIMEEECVRENGCPCWLWIKVRSIRNAAGDLLYLEGSAVDVTERKLAAQRQEVQFEVARILAEALDLAAAAPRLLQVLTANSAFQTSALWSVDPRGQAMRCIEFWQRPDSHRDEFEQATRELQLPRGQGLPGRVWQSGQHAAIVNLPADLNFPRARLAERAGLRGGFAFPIKLGQEVLGALEFFTTELRPLDDQTLQMYAVVGNEIGQYLGHRRLEEGLRQAQKMEAIGVLAAGVAHDFNNLLTIIIGYCEMLMSRPSIGKEIIEYLHPIHQAGERATTLTRQLLTFSRKQINESIALSLNTILREDEQMLRRLIGEDVELVVKLAANLLAIKADPGQIEQVILNLSVNARDAMPRGGRLQFETTNVTISETQARQYPSIGAGTYAMLAVSDTGVGMDAETQKRIFEPFFTTKEVGKGTGLGLATVYAIVQQNRGFLEVHSEPGRGTMFRIFFPTVSDKPGSRLLQKPALRAQGRVLVLLVEDDPNVREIAKMTLESQGYQVLVAKDGLDALTVAKQTTEPIHLLLTDVIMPKMNGSDLAAQLAVLAPGMKVLFMSGFAGDMLTRNGVLENASLISKPFTPLALAMKLAEVLNPTAKK